jgi:hypothetical protein
MVATRNQKELQDEERGRVTATSGLNKFLQEQDCRSVVVTLY